MYTEGNMLRDSEIVRLRGDKNYRAATAAGLKQFAHDLVSSGGGDLKPEVSSILKIAYTFAKARLIRQELALVSAQLLEQMLNFELNWPRKADSVRAICESDHTFLWMRYDVPRIEALFGRAKFLLTDATYRDVVKQHSSITGNKNDRLAQMLIEVAELEVLTNRSIATRGLYDDLVKLQSNEYYRRHETEIQQRFVQASQAGALGALPAADAEAAERESPQ